MPSPTSYQIKPRVIPQREYSENLTIPEDVAKANKSPGVSALKGASLGIACGSLFLAVVIICGAVKLMVRLKLISDPDPDVYLTPFNVLLMCAGVIVIPALSLKLFEWIIINKLFRKKLREVASERLCSIRQSEQSKENSTAVAVSGKLNVIYVEQESSLQSLQSLFEDTTRVMSRAEQLFVEKAYVSFWDSIEEVLELLKKINNRARSIQASAKEYYGQLEGREHTFPAFPVKSADVPNANGIVQRLTQAIDVANRDFQFASIYEQRKTTRAIVAGFRNMQEAITGLRNDIVSSISDLQYSLDSGLQAVRSEIGSLGESQQKSASELRETLESHAESAQERDKREVKHQEFVKGALDNIQRGKKPADHSL